MWKSGAGLDEQKILSLIDETLEKLLPKHSEGPMQMLYEGARYLAFAPSKRIRPLFLISTALEFKVPISQTLYPACALELIHTYSLIHDDLPCMDDDDMRRGQPSVHKVYGEAVALLIGDFLLTLSFEALSSAPELTPSKKISLVKILSEHAGAEGMVGGQAMDLKKIDSAEEINKRKTGSLFVAAFQAGAILGNASSMRSHELMRAGEKVGLLFQLVDDILDGDCLLDEESLNQTNVLYNETLALIGNNPFSLELVSKIFKKIPVLSF